MEKKVTRYINECDTCQRTKVDHTVMSGLLQPIPMAAIPWWDIAMDFLTDLPTVFGLYHTGSGLPLLEDDTLDTPGKKDRSARCS